MSVFSENHLSLLVVKFTIGENPKYGTDRAHRVLFGTSVGATETSDPAAIRKRKYSNSELEHPTYS